MLFLKTWITNIVVVVILSALIEVLMPSSEMKRFVKVFTGLLVILVIVQPFVLIKDIKSEFNMNVLETASILDAENEPQAISNMSAYQNKQAVELYRKKITDYITGHITEQSEIAREDVMVHLDIEENSGADFGKLKHVNIVIKNGAGHAVAVNTIENIQINSNKNVMKKTNKEYNFSDSQLSTEIKKNLSKLLDIEETCITVEE